MRITATPDDRVKGSLPAGEVHVGDERCGDGGLCNLRAAGDDPQQPRLDERLEGRAEHRLERRMERVQLQQDGATMFEDLADHVGGGEAGHIARPEHGGHTPRPRPLLGFTTPATIEGVESTRIHTSHGGPMAAKDHPIEQCPHRHDVDFDHRGRIGGPWMAAGPNMGEPRRSAGLRQAAIRNLGLGPRREQQQPQCGQWTGGDLLCEGHGSPLLHGDGRVGPVVGHVGDPLGAGTRQHPAGGSIAVRMPPRAGVERHNQVIQPVEGIRHGGRVSRRLDTKPSSKPAGQARQCGWPYGLDRIPLACASGFHGAGVEASVIPGSLAHYTDPLLADAVPRKDPIDEVGAKFNTGHLADRGYRLMEQSGHDRLVTRSAAAD